MERIFDAVRIVLADRLRGAAVLRFLLTGATVAASGVSAAAGAGDASTGTAAGWSGGGATTGCSTAADGAATCGATGGGASRWPPRSTKNAMPPAITAPAPVRIHGSGLRVRADHPLRAARHRLGERVRRRCALCGNRRRGSRLRRRWRRLAHEPTGRRRRGIPARRGARHRDAASLAACLERAHRGREYRAAAAPGPSASSHATTSSIAGGSSGRSRRRRPRRLDDLLHRGSTCSRRRRTDTSPVSIRYDEHAERVDVGAVIDVACRGTARATCSTACRSARRCASCA